MVGILHGFMLIREVVAKSMEGVENHEFAMRHLASGGFQTHALVDKKATPDYAVFNAIPTVTRDDACKFLEMRVHQ